MEALTTLLYYFENSRVGNYDPTLPVEGWYEM